MNDNHPASGPESPNPSPLLEIDRLSDAFEKSWRSGTRPFIESYLGKATDRAREALLRELLGQELELRQGGGEVPELREYLNRFPEDAAVINIVFRSDQFERAWAAGHGPRIEDYLDEVTGAEGPALLGELLGLELELRQDGGEEPQAREYHERFPDQKDLVDAVFHKIDPTCSASVHGEAEAIGSASDDQPLLVSYFGDYVDLEEIARGAMGVVYRARQVSLNRPVALKMIRSAHLASEAARRRFLLEAEQTANLDHPHIVPIYEVGEHQGQHYYSMKLIEGGSLAEKITAYVGDPDTSARFMATVARAVHAAHRGGILHRDLKPGNILIDKQGQPHITDFGLAKRIEGGSGLSLSGDIIGSPSYMSPEQAEGRKDITTTADVYGLGAILYELLTGQPPFTGKALDVLDQVRNSDPVPPRSRRSSIDRDLETICLKSLSKAPEDRYGSAEALAEDLERWIRREPVVARPATPLERVTKWVRRRPAIAALSAAVAVSIVLSVTLIALGFRAVNRSATIAQGMFEEAHRQSVKAQEQEAEAKRQKTLAQRKASALAQDRGVARRAQGEVGEGVLWLAHALKVCPDQDPETADSLRLLLDAWDRHVNHLDAVLPTPGAPICTEVSPGGGFVATATEDGLVQVWDTINGSPVGVPIRQPAKVSSLRLDRGARKLAVISDNKTVRLWDIIPGTPIGRPILLPGGFDRDHEVVSFNNHGVVSFNADGSRMVTCSRDGTAQLWDTTDGTAIGPPFTQRPRIAALALSSNASDSVVAYVDGTVTRPGSRPLIHEGRVTAVAITSDGHSIAAAGENGVAEIHYFEDAKAVYHRWWGWAFAFSPDGKSIITAADDWTARAWNLTTGATIGKRLRHDQRIEAVAFNPNGRTVATAGANIARLWNASTGEAVGKVMDHPGTVLDLRFSPDGKLVLTVCADKAARFWSADDGTPVGQPITHARAIRKAVFSPNGLILGTVEERDTDSDRHEARLWSTRDATQIGKPLTHKSQIFDLVFSPDGRLVLTTQVGGAAQLWSVTEGSPVGDPMGHKVIAGAAFSPDGKHILTWDLLSESVRLWYADEAPGFEYGSLVLPKTVCAAAFSPDPMIIAVASGNDVRLYKWVHANGKRPEAKPFGQWMSHGDEVHAIAFSPDGKRIATASDDQTVRLWDASNGTPIGQPMRHPIKVRIVQFSPDGKTLATRAFDGSVRVWRATDGALVEPASARLRAIVGLAFSPDGKELATAGEDQSIHLWDVKTGVHRQRIDHPEAIAIATVIYSPDGKAIATTGSDKAARLFSSVDGKLMGQPFGREEKVETVAFSPDGKLLAAACGDGTARLWDARDGKPVGKPMSHPVGVKVVAFSPDGTTLVTHGVDNAVRAWDVVHGSPLGAPMAHPDLVRASAFSPNGKLLATACGDRSLRLWNARDGKPVGEPLFQPIPVSSMVLTEDRGLFAACENGSIHRWNITGSGLVSPSFSLWTRGVHDVAFSPDGKLLATARDQTIRLWNALDGKQVGPAMHQLDVSRVSFSPDGQHLIARSAEGVYQLWNVDVPPAGAGFGSPALDGFENWQFSPDGRLVAIEGGNGVRLLHTADSSPAGDRLVGGEDGVKAKSIRFSPDGKLVATVDADDTVRLFGPDGRPTGATVKLPWTANEIAFSPDGTVLAVSHGLETRLFHVVDGSPLGQALPGQFATFAPEPSRTIITKERGIARVWKVARGFPPLRVLSPSNGIGFVGDSRNNRIIATCGDSYRDDARTVQLWDASDGSPVGEPLVLPAKVYRFEVSPDGKTLATLDDDKTVLRLWRVSDRVLLGQMIHPKGVHELTFSPDGQVLATAGGDDRTVRLWRASDGAPLDKPMVHPRAVGRLGFSPDGQMLASIAYAGADEQVFIWKIPGNLLVGPPLPSHYPTKVDFVAGGKWLALADGRSVRFWNTADASPVDRALPHGHHITDLRPLQDGMFLATASDEDGSAQLWRVADGARVGGPIAPRKGKVRLQSNPRASTLVTSYSDGSTWMWRAEDGSPIGPPIQMPDDDVPPDLSADGRLITARLSKNSFGLWSTHDGSPLGRPVVLPDKIDVLQFCNGGSRLLAKSDGKLYLWEVPSISGITREQWVLRTQLAIGREISEDGSLTVIELDHVSWQRRSRSFSRSDTTAHPALREKAGSTRESRTPGK